MGQLLQPVIENTFDGGICEDTRQPGQNECSMCQHFDFYSKEHQLIPYRDMEDEGGSLSGYNIGSVKLFTDSGGTQNIFALGSVPSQTWPQILEKGGNIITSSFAGSTGGADTTGAVIPSSLVGYRTKLIFLKTLSSNTVVMSYDPATDTLATVGTITGTSSSGIYPKMYRHPQDDILYIGVGNVVATLDNTTFTAAAFTFPSNLTITSFTDYGPFLASACAPKDQGGKSWVFLWGRDTSLETVDDTIDWEEGSLMVIENVGGVLIGIKSQAQSGGSILDINPKLVFSRYTGGTPQPFKEIQWEGTGTPTTLLHNFKEKKGSNLFFAARQYLRGRTVYQIWVVGRSSSGGFFVSPDRKVNNDTAITSIEGFNIIGDYLWTAYDGNGSLKRTNSTASFTASSIWEKKFTLGDSRTTKETKGASVMFEPFLDDEAVTLSYEKNDETSFTPVAEATASDQNSVVHRSVVTPTGDWNEITFQVESVNGGVVTGLRFQPEIKMNDVY